MASALRVAVIGAGNMGRHHARIYASMSDNVQLVAIADSDPATANLSEAYGAAHYTAYEEMLEREQPTAVSIAAPTSLHLPLATAALNAGIHVLVEKPIAGTTHEADALAEAARSSSALFTVGHVERFNPAVRTLKRFVDEGMLGTVSSLSSRRVGGFPAYQPPTDVILDLAIHDIDVMSMLLGQSPTVLAAHGSRTYHPYEIDSAEILLGFGSASGMIQTNWITPIKVRTLAATGSLGYAEINYITQEVKVFEHQTMPSQPGFDSFVNAFGEPRVTVYRDPLAEPLQLEIEAFLHAIRSGETDQLMSADDARDAVRVAVEALNAL